MNDYFKQIVANPKFIFYVIQDQDQEYGYVWIEIRSYKENAFCKAYRSIFVHHLCILSTYRNRGIGKELMKKVYEVARSHQIKKVEMDYWANNEAAEIFYKQQGFIENLFIKIYEGSSPRLLDQPDPDQSAVKWISLDELEPIIL